MLCGLNHYQSFEVSQTGNILKGYLKSFWRECQKIFENNHETYGIVDYVRPIDIENQDESCFHILTLKDGTEFNLIFPHVKFTEIEPRLQTGYAVKITYKYNQSNIHPINDYPDNHRTNLINHKNPQIINIYPRPYSKTTTYECLPDEGILIENDAPVRVHFLEDQIVRIDFLHEDKIKTE